MAKLYFRYGAVGSAKTLNLLAVAHSYRSQGKKILLLKPELDTRFGKEAIRSRSGLEKEADILINEKTRLAGKDFIGLHCILVDEAQFLTRDFIDHLGDIVRAYNIPVICFGLRTDFKRGLFEGSKRLMEISDSIEEVKTTCHFCNRKALFNIKFVGDSAVLDGPVIELGAEEKYLPTCRTCYYEKTKALR
jgi:thymidine kinase